MQKFDYLIIGQGIAGTTLAWQLHQRHQRFVMVDDPELPSATLVAAGIFNPLTGRKLVKTWLADELFPYAVRFYTEMEKILDTKLLHQTEIYRPYRNVAEQIQYLELAKTSAYRPYISTLPTNFPKNHFIKAADDGLTVLQSGWVDLPRFLEKSRRYFEQSGCFRAAHFSSADLRMEEETVTWNGMQFSNIINCTGVGARRDPLFNWLPFNPVKGQIMDCEIEGYDISQIVNQGVFILPVSENTVRVGATYSWHDLDWNVTEDGRDYLSEKLGKLLKVPFSVQSQQAGIRPSSKDRRPFVGRHPQYKSIFIFNGLGTKGVTLAPFFSRQLVNLLLSGEELYSDVNIERYFSLYSNPRTS